MAGTVLAGQKLTSALLGMPAWTALTLAASWTDTGGGNVGAQYRLWKLTNEVEVIGKITAGTLTDGTTIATLPSGYTPASTQSVAVTLEAGTGSAGSTTPRISVTSTGALKIYGIPSGTTVISFHGRISLDA